MQEILSKKNIGERIKDLRIANSLSQAFVADILNLSRSNYSQIELGNQYPTFNTLHTIARYYSKTYEWLLEGNENNNYSFKETDAVILELENTLKSFSSSIQQLEKELNQLKIRRAGLSL